jgi:phosphomannomutase
MVTASHNPAKDNGYKVYLGGSHGGSQIVSPTDKQMAVAINAVAKTLRYEQIARAEVYQVGGQEIIDAYLATTAALVKPAGANQLKVVYTAMHGVGWSFTKRLFSMTGLNEPVGVSQQLEPDGNFPTTAFPNPEEPGALDLAFLKAVEAKADLIVAHDPDADRLAVAIATGSEPAHRRLTGDEVGLLLGHHLAEKAMANGVKGTLATTVVSGSPLAKVAKKHKLKFAETLTGFKHLARVPNLVFAYEEALGYSVNPAAVPDKDGISAALVFVSMANELAASGISIAKQLEELGKLYGHFATSQLSLRVKKQADLTKLMTKLRQKPPAKLDKTAYELTDLLDSKLRLPKTDLLRYQLTDGRRIVIRPSGTEPKLKCYLQVEADSAASAFEGLQNLEAVAKKLLGLEQRSA